MTEIQIERKLKELIKGRHETYHDRMLRLQEEYGEFR